MKKVKLAAVLAALVVAVPADAATFLFSQGGYTDGASVTGSFMAEDLNNDGIINSLQGELSGFSAQFTGNGLIAPFQVDISQLIGLYYTPDIFSIITASTPQLLVNVGAGGTCAPVCGVLLSPAGVDFTIAAPSIAAVPEPTAWGMMLAGFAAIGAAMRRRRTTARLA